MKNLVRFYEKNIANDNSSSSFKSKQRRGEKDPMANNRKKRNDISYNNKKK